MEKVGEIENEEFSIKIDSLGNTVAIYVTYFGEHLSTALLFFDTFPVATRFFTHFRWLSSSIIIFSLLDIISNRTKNVFFQH